MSMYGLNVSFGTIKEYYIWKREWTKVQKQLTLNIRERRRKLLELCAERADIKLIAKAQKDWFYEKVMGAKFMNLLETAKERRNRLIKMNNDIREQFKTFPLSVESRVIDFHFNKGNLIYADMPSWIVKARGKTYLLHHVDIINGTVTTRENLGGGTKGMLRIKNAVLEIDKDGAAVIRGE
jgi:hypothetical protein